MNPGAESALPTTEIVTKDKLIEQVKAKILARFGTVINLETMAMEQRSWDKVNLLGNCGEVARITQNIVGGTVKELIHNKHKAELYFLDDRGQRHKIADGLSQAFHAYVLAEDQKVWDPTLNIWGDLDESRYLNKISKS